MQDNTATARAQAGEALERLIQSLKRQQRATKDAIQFARQAQVGLLGITVTTHADRGGHDGHSSTEGE